MRERRLTVGLIIAAFLAMSIVGCSQGPWMEYIPDGEDFTVEFPGEPEIKTTSQNLGPGISMDTTEYSVPPKLRFFGALYTVSISKIIAANPESLQWDDAAALQGARSGIKSEGGKVVAEKAISMAGYEGWEFEVTSPRGDSTLRMFRKDFTIYGFEVFRSKGKKLPEETARFFDSFKFDSAFDMDDY